jgi:hypothetical protein
LNPRVVDLPPVFPAFFLEKSSSNVDSTGILVVLTGAQVHFSDICVIVLLQPALSFSLLSGPFVSDGFHDPMRSRT